MKIGRAFTSLIPLAVAAPVLLRAQPALACAACFGKADSTLAHGMNMGIFALLFVVGVMWVAFGAFFIYLARRAKASAKKLSAPVSEPINPVLIK